MNAETGGGEGVGVGIGDGSGDGEGWGEGARMVTAALGAALLGVEWQTLNSIVATARAADRRVSTGRTIANRVRGSPTCSYRTRFAGRRQQHLRAGRAHRLEAGFPRR